MPRYKIIIEYDGTDFAGWQRQPADRTVQEELENALSEFGEGHINVIGAGRTDSGVHALGQTAHFDLNYEIAIESLLKALNAKTEDDLLIKHIEIAKPDFHARYDAVSRRYLYIISLQPTVIGRRFSWYPRFDYNFKLLESLTAEIIGEYDFAAFCKTKSLKENTVCTVYHAAWTENPSQRVFEITADRFLHHMVRLMVGTMMNIAAGGMAPDIIPEIIASKDVSVCGAPAPPNGLFLAEVKY
ncbi:tRNA pseudouridine(38-40) synthase TruA [bacterium]|nr:tRNA pseudouridine(38-40) synthase TruA [bacterium]